MLLLKCQSLSFEQTPRSFAQNTHVSSCVVVVGMTFQTTATKKRWLQRPINDWVKYTTTMLRQNWNIFDAFLPLKCKNFVLILIFKSLSFWCIRAICGIRLQSIFSLKYQICFNENLYIVKQPLCIVLRPLYSCYYHLMDLQSIIRLSLNFLTILFWNSSASISQKQ